MPWMEKGKEARWCPDGSNRAPDSLANSQGSDHSAWMSSMAVALQHPFKVGVFRLLAVDRPPPGMCLISAAPSDLGFCSQGQQGWCLEPCWPGLSSQKLALQGPRRYRDCWGRAVGWGAQFNLWEALQSQIVPKEPPLTTKGAQMMNTFQGNRPDFNSHLEISGDHPLVPPCHHVQLLNYGIPTLFLVYLMLQNIN